MNTTVFIILASYNGIDYIEQQLDSLLSQSWPCLIYIFDDISTDGTVNLIKDKYRHHKNIILTENHERMGYVKNFEQGIKKAHKLGAKYIALSDQDDIWHPDKLSRTMPAILSSPLNKPTLVFSDLSMTDSYGTITHPSYLSYRAYTPRTTDSSNLLATALGQNGIMGNTILMNRALVDNILPFPETLHAHDYWISLIAQLSGKCVFIPERLVNYRIHAKNTSNSIHTLEAKKNSQSNSFLKKLKRRNYILPYKEDSRAETIINLLHRIETRSITNVGTPKIEISRTDQELITGFLRYLNFDRPRYFLAYWMLKNKFIRNEWKYKANFIYRTLATKKYPPK